MSARRVIVTGDDFGLAVPVNEAIAEAHSRGALTAASLMVGAEASADAVRRARSLPSLKVGLHVTLVEGQPVLPPQEVPGLVDECGEFSTELVRAGFRFFLRPGLRSQMEAEIRAQFETFRSTGLSLDHVNVHNHMHLHPTVLGLILRVGPEFGMKAVRLPYEPPLRSWRASGKALLPRLAASALLLPLLMLMRSRFRRQQLRFNDYLFGMADTGAMTLELVLSLLRHLPEGVSEFHFHPATRRCREIDRTMPGYLNEEEFRTLTNPALLDAFQAAGLERVAFSDL